MAASEISKKGPVIFNTIAGCKTPSYILFIWNFYQTFYAYYYDLQCSFSQSSSVLIFAGGEAKMFFDIR